MKIDNKKKRIDSDAGFLVLRPEEFAKLKGTGLKESDNNDFVTKYQKLKGELSKRKRQIVAGLGDDEIMLMGSMPEFFVQMGNAICDMFGKDGLKFIDSGSFKVCAVYQGGYALKTSLRSGGMEDEIQNSRNFPDLTCFPKLIDFDGNNYDSCIVEAVNPLFGDAECKKFYGVTRNKIVALLSGEEPADNADQTFMLNLKRKSGAAWDSVRDLQRFFKEYKPLFDIADGNWGLAIRNGQEVPIILDYDM